MKFSIEIIINKNIHDDSSEEGSSPTREFVMKQTVVVGSVFAMTMQQDFHFSSATLRRQLQVFVEAHLLKNKFGITILS